MGMGPDKLYLAYRVFADRGNQLEPRALTVGQDYNLTIEAFNENGVSAVSEVAYFSYPKFQI